MSKMAFKKIPRILIIFHIFACVLAVKDSNDLEVKSIKKCGTVTDENPIQKYQLFPGLVAIEFEDENNIRTIKCIGALISPKYVVTTGTCMNTYLQTLDSLLNIIIPKTESEHSTQSIKISRRIKTDDIDIHEKFAIQNKSNNIALIRLVEQVTADEMIPVCLPDEWSNGFIANYQQKELLTAAGLNFLKTSAKIQLFQEKFEAVNCHFSEEISAEDQEEYRLQKICIIGSSPNSSLSGVDGTLLLSKINDSWTLLGIGKLENDLTTNNFAAGHFTSIMNYKSWIEKNV